MCVDMTENIKPTNAMLRLHPLYQKILVKMYKFGMNEDYEYNEEKGKIWLSRIARLVGVERREVDMALDVLLDNDVIHPTEHILEKITDSDDNKVKYVRCYVISKDYLDNIKEWI